MSNAKVVAWTQTMSQDADSCAPAQVDQHLEVQMTDGGGGPFYVLKTERWAFDNIKELVDQLKEMGVPYNG